MIDKQLCRFCGEAMPFEPRWSDSAEAYFKFHHCLECDYIKDVFDPEYNKECKEEDQHRHEVEQDYLASVL